MQVIGLTGSMGTGKTTVACMLKDMDIPVHDADATVHELLKSNPTTIQQIETHFPTAVQNQEIDR